MTANDPVRKYLLCMRNRKLRHIRSSGAFCAEATKSRDRKRPCSEVGSAHTRLFPAFFFLSSSNMATEGHLTPSEFPWVCATGSCATPVVVVNNVGCGVLYNVRVLCLAWLLELNTRILYLAGLPELNTCVLCLAW